MVWPGKEKRNLKECGSRSGDGRFLSEHSKLPTNVVLLISKRSCDVNWEFLPMFMIGKLE